MLKKPIHITPTTLIHFSKTNYSSLSPKADGIPKTLRIKIRKRYYVLMVEYIKNLDLHLVYDVKIKKNNNILDRMRWLRDNHKYGKKVKIGLIKSTKELINIINEDSNILKDYLSKSQDKIKWYPKITFNPKLIKCEDYLRLLEAEIELPYKTDGWIISDCKRNIYKYKPIKERTVDLLKIKNQWYSKNGIYTGPINLQRKLDSLKDGIWRCYWEDKWIPRDHRNDKIYPNPSWLIKKMEEYNKNPWRSIDLISYLENVYYDHKRTTLLREEEEYLRDQKSIFFTNLKSIVNENKIVTVLDIGCGKGNINQILDSSIRIIGIDIDAINIYKSSQYYPRSEFYWGDMTKEDFSISERFKIDINDKYDLIIFNNSLHYCLNKNGLENMITKVHKILNEGGLLYICFIDHDKLEDQYKRGRIEIIRVSNNEYSFKYPWKSNTFREKMVSYSKLKKVIDKKFRIVKEYNKEDLIHRYILLKKCKV